MHAHTAEDKKRRRRHMPWSRRRVVFLLGLLAAIAVPVLLAGVHRYRADRRLDAKLDEIRASGLPATTEELNAWYPEVPAEENAAPLYREAFDAVKDGQEEYPYWKLLSGVDRAPKGGRLPEDLLATMRAYLADNAEALRLLHEAARRPACRFPVDLSEGFAVKLRHLSDIRRSVRLLGFEALVAAHDGNAQQAFDALLDSIATADALCGQPILDSQYVGAGCHDVSVTDLERVLQVTDFTEEQLALMQHAFAVAEDPDAMVRALATERASGLSAYAAPGAYIDKVGGVEDWEQFVPGSTRLLAQSGAVVGWFDLEREEYLDYMGAMIDANRLPYSDALDAMERIQQEMDYSGLIPTIADSLLSEPLASAEARAHDAASLNSAVTAIAIERYRATYGRPPEDLGQLVPDFLDAVPIDPFDAKPLRYVPSNGGCLLYSVGADRHDDQGTPQTQFGDSGDQVFMLLFSGQD